MNLSAFYLVLCPYFSPNIGIFTQNSSISVIQEVFQVYLNKFAVIHLFLIIICNNEFI